LKESASSTEGLAALILRRNAAARETGKLKFEKCVFTRHLEFFG
jgi:hypothetical protein